MLQLKLFQLTMWGRVQATASKDARHTGAQAFLSRSPIFGGGSPFVDWPATPAEALAPQVRTSPPHLQHGSWFLSCCKVVVGLPRLATEASAPAERSALECSEASPGMCSQRQFSHQQHQTHCSFRLDGMRRLGMFTWLLQSMSTFVVLIMNQSQGMQR